MKNELLPSAPANHEIGCEEQIRSPRRLSRMILRNSFQFSLNIIHLINNDYGFLQERRSVAYEWLAMHALPGDNGPDQGQALAAAGG